MGVRLNFEGMNELRSALQALPQEMQDKAQIIVLTHASAAKNEIQGAYPTGRTGNLRSRVTVTSSAGRVGTVSVVKSGAPHAWIFEHGTGNRVTSTGANRGRMPEAPVSEQMIPKVVRLRNRMVQELIAFVRELGFDVSGA
jgi:Bacteriophage HK97-gp10, putative tail-component